MIGQQGQGLGQIGQPQQQEDKFTIDTASQKNKEAGAATKEVGRPQGTAGLGVPPQQPAQQASYSQQAVEAVLSGKVDPQVVMNDPNVSEQAKMTIQQALST